MSQTFVHIVPNLPPQNSGVGDYATLVGRRMEEIGGVRCAYVAAGHQPVAEPANCQEIRNITGACNGDQLWPAVGDVTGQSSHISVVLHYSGYGYDRNGSPEWLVKALLSRPLAIDRVLTYFHELYADGWPWQRAFWYSNRQRSIAAEIARLSDFVLTNRAESAEWLEQQASLPAGSVGTLAICSNIGEPQVVTAHRLRLPRAAAFGNARWKRFALFDQARVAADYLRRLGISELIDIGEPSDVNARSFDDAGISIKQLGYLSAIDVSQLLETCRVGFVEYPMHGVAKSGIFAAYASHGVVPILRDGCGHSADGVVIGIHALALGSTEVPAEANLEHISNTVRHWYSAHSSIDHAWLMQRHACQIRVTEYLSR